MAEAYGSPRRECGCGCPDLPELQESHFDYRLLHNLSRTLFRERMC